MKKTAEQIEMARTIAAAKKQYGKRWFALAQSWSRNMPATKQLQAIRHLHPKHAAGAKARNIGSLAESLLKIETLARAIREARAARRIIHLPSRLVYLSADLFKPTRQPSLQERLVARIKTAAKQAVHQATNSPTRDTIYIQITDDPAKIGQTTEVDTCRPYGGNYKTWSANEYTRRFTVPHRYLSRVVKRGLAVVGGMMTLDAAPVDSPVRGITVYAATWLQESRGYQCKTISGYIALADSGGNYHGKTVAAAVRGLQNKIVMTPEKRQARSQAYLEGRLTRALNSCSGRIFTFADARRLGFCEYGIASWCDRVGIDPDGTATIEEIVSGYRKAPLTEARQFILHYCR